MYTLNCKGKLLVIDKPLVMGIINATPDSFYEHHNGEAAIIAQAAKMLEEGAAILDIGGQSTRPGSTRISATEEQDRVLPVIELLAKAYPNCILSIDTYHSKVADAAVKAGASIVNDISAGNMDDAMLTTVGALQVPYICMHMKGTPENMQTTTEYTNVVLSVVDFFIQKIADCKNAGITDIIIDPGFGFGKTIEQNFILLKNLKQFEMLDKPILAGLSRKGTIYKTLHTTADKALNGTSILNGLAVLNGAAILRVHDVREAREAIILLEAYNNC